jgi:hypothetical protein
MSIKKVRVYKDITTEEILKHLAQPYDRLHKKTFSNIENVINFLALYLNLIYVGNVIIDSVQPIGTHWLDNTLHETISDTMFCCNITYENTEKCRLIVNIEEQTVFDNTIILRIRRYFDRIFESEYNEILKTGKLFDGAFSSPVSFILYPGDLWDKLPKKNDAFSGGKFLVESKSKRLTDHFGAIYEILNFGEQEKIMSECNYELQTYRLAMHVAAMQTMEVEYKKVIDLLAKACAEISDKQSKKDLISCYTVFIKRFIPKSSPNQVRELMEGIDTTLNLGETMDLIDDTILSYASTSLAQIEARVVAQAEARGEARGAAREAVKTAANSIIKVLNHKFGPISQGLERKIREITDLDKLSILFDTSLVVKSLDEFEKLL